MMLSYLLDQMEASTRQWSGTGKRYDVNWDFRWVFNIRFIWEVEFLLKMVDLAQLRLPTFAV